MLCYLVLVRFPTRFRCLTGDEDTLNWIMGGVLGEMDARNELSINLPADGRMNVEQAPHLPPVRPLYQY